jgi:ribosomal protein S18 acetylase RimI-like enzyme
MSEIAIREALEADLAAVLRTYEEAGIDAGVSFTAEEAREHFAKLRQYPYYRVFVAETEGNVAGTYALIILDTLAKRGACAGVVEEVAVLPAFQGRGIGRAMMEHALEECRLAGCYKMTLSSNVAREGAHRFYDALGFERHGYSFLMRI